jgi:Big-like domain-containing protein
MRPTLHRLALALVVAATAACGGSDSGSPLDPLERSADQQTTGGTNGGQRDTTRTADPKKGEGTADPAGPRNTPGTPPDKPLPAPPDTTPQLVLQPMVATLRIGERIRLDPGLASASGTSRPVDPATVTWTSQDPAIATVSGGQVTAVAPGYAVIIAVAGGRRAYAKIAVIDPATGQPPGGEVPPTTPPKPIPPVQPDTTPQLVLQPLTSILHVGERVRLTPVLVRANGATTPVDPTTVTWTSLVPEVATVSGGEVTGVAVGSGAIVATAGGRRAYAKIAVQ